MPVKNVVVDAAIKFASKVDGCGQGWTFILLAQVVLSMSNSFPCSLCFAKQDEASLFEAAAQHAYESFRDKAAESRGMTKEAMQEVRGLYAVVVGTSDLEKG
jgi:hypothetical protein